MNRREFLAGVASLPLGAAPSRKPDIIFILADDLGYFDLGCYGQKEIRTPNIDRLAAQGTRFTGVYAGAAVCAPSRCALMTGLHTGHGRIRNNHSQRTGGRVSLEPSDLTAAQILKNAGYATAIYGKWGIGEDGSEGVPNKKGFDDWFGFLNQDHAVDYYTDYLFHNGRKETLQANLNGAKGEYVQDLFTREALGFIGRHRNDPFFLYLPYTTPHMDHVVPSDAPYSSKPWDQENRNYAAMITRLDADVGRIVDQLRKQNLDGDTIVFFASDNGSGYVKGFPVFHSNGNFRGKKAELYEAGIRVPMIARWQGRIPAGRVSSEPWAFYDFMPTAAELAGMRCPDACDGVSVVPTLMGQPQPQRDCLYWETNNRDGFTQAVRSGKWKAVRFEETDTIELYDLSAGPEETRNLAAANAGVVERMRGYMQKAHVDNAEYPIKASKKKKKK